MLMLLQHDNARPHNSAVVWQYRISDVKLFFTLPTAKIWHSLTSGLQLPSNISKELISHVMKQCHLLQETGFKNSLKNSTVTGSKNLFTAGSIVSNKRERLCGKLRYTCGNKLHTMSYILCFVAL
jgi:hypothetical protein